MRAFFCTFGVTCYRDLRTPLTVKVTTASRVRTFRIGGHR